MPEATAASDTVPEATAASEAMPEPTSAGEITEKEFEELDPTNFGDSTNITNEWLPLKPGTEWVYEGATVEDGESIPHRLVVTVTDLTKVIGDVRTLVLWDQDFADGELVEAELAFYAQDNDGNVWYLGEYPEEYENGEFVDAPAWIHGFEDALAGIAMKADPQLGTPSYSQGWGPAVDWTDRGQVDGMGQQTCVPFDCYEDVLVIAESSRGEANAFQLKSYARGVGNVQVGWRGDDPTQETLELVKIVQLGPKGMEKARNEAMALEKHGFEISPDVYGQTPPLEPMPAQ
jgi:hypothetical protein